MGELVRVPNKNQRLFFLSTLGFPMPALAHGESVLLLPIGQAAALVFVALVLAVVGRLIGYSTAVSAFLCALVVSVLVWFLPGSVFSPVAKSDWVIFAAGFVPPMIVAAVVAVLARRTRPGT